MECLLEMKVLHFISAPAAGGAEVYVKDLVRCATKNGNNTAVVFLGDSESIGRCNDYQKKYLSELEQLGIKYYFLKKGSRRNIFSGLISFKKILTEYSPDIIHCHLFYAVFYSMFFSRKIVYTHHNIMIKINRSVFRFFDCFIDTYVGICGVCYKMLKCHTNKPVVQINNAIDPERIKAKSGVTKRKKINIIMVGGLIEQKNYFLALESMLYLKGYDYQLLIAGEGGLRSDIENKILEYQLQDNVKLMGNISDINQFYSKGDIFLMTSKWEGLPIALIEASIRGIPVVVTDVGGCSEVVHNMQNGYVVDELSPELISKSLKKLIDSPKDREDIRNIVSVRKGVYEISAAYKSHYELYSRLLS